MSEINDTQLALKAENINLGYILPDLSITTLKEALIALARGRLLKKKRHYAIKNSSIYAKKGECIALLGHNGSGKSTFLKVIAGIIKPQTGTLTVNGPIAPLIELGAGFDPELTGYENIYLSCSLMGLTRQEIDQKLDSIKQFSELKNFLERPVKTYSSGMYMRLAFSCAMAIDADIMLIDEILAVGDQNFQKKCLSKIYEIRNSGATVILVSHDINTVRQLADRVYVMDEGEIIFEGSADQAVKVYDDTMYHRAVEIISEEHKEEAERRKALIAKSGVGRHGERVVIEKVRMYGLNQSHDLTTAQPGTLCVDINIKDASVGDLVVGFAFMRGTLRITGGNTKMFNCKVNGGGRYTIRYNFKSLPFSTGDFSVIAAVHDSEIIECFDLKVDVLRFRVQNPKDEHNFDHDLISPYEIIDKIDVVSQEQSEDERS